MKPIDADILKTILRRSVEGEGVEAIVRSLGLNVNDTMLSLQQNHGAQIVAAKQAQRERIERGE